MRDAFWGTLHDIKFKEFYLENYSAHAGKIDTFFSILTGLTSAAGIAGWGIWRQFSWIWVTLLAASQVAQVIRPLLPYSRRLTALKYLIPEIRQLSLEVETFWYKAEDDQTPDYHIPLYEYRKRYIDMENRYLGSDPLPDIQKLRKTAENQTANHLRLFFGTTEGDENNAEEARYPRYAAPLCQLGLCEALALPDFSDIQIHFVPPCLID